MGRRLRLYCHRCRREQQFMHTHASHGPYSGGHQDWHCTVCGDCSYSLARPDRQKVPAPAAKVPSQRTSG